MNTPVFFFAIIVMFTTSADSNTTSLPAPEKIAHIPLPEGYKRIFQSENSFGFYLRELPLKKDQTVYLYNGQRKNNQSAQYAVLKMSVGDKDLQQCADAVMRLRAEYLKQQNKPICFADNNRKTYCWAQYKQRGWQGYLETVFGMCGTISLEKELKQRTWTDITPGDVLIKGGSPGHAVVVMDVAQHNTTGELIFLLAQSYMPAQDIHVLKNTSKKSLSPWYSVESNKIIETPEWTFYASQLRKWP